MDKETKRKESLKKAGYFTVNILLQKLQELKDKGYGDELVGSDFEHYQYFKEGQFGKNYCYCYANDKFELSLKE